MNMMKSLGRALLALSLTATFLNAPVPAIAALTSARVVTANFSAVGSGSSLVLKNGESFTYQVLSGQNGTQANKTVLQKSCDGSNFGDFSVPISTTNNSAGGTFTATIAAEPCSGGKSWVRFQVTSYTSGASSTTLTEVDNVVSSLYNNANQSVMDILDGGAQDNGYRKVAGLLTAQAGLTVSAGALNPLSRTIAQLQAVVPVVGDTYVCTNCSPPKIVVATGTSAGNFADAVGAVFK